MKTSNTQSGDKCETVSKPRENQVKVSTLLTILSILTVIGLASAAAIYGASITGVGDVNATRVFLGSNPVKGTGTLTDTKYCVWDAAGDEFDCDSEGGSFPDEAFTNITNTITSLTENATQLTDTSARLDGNATLLDDTSARLTGNATLLADTSAKLNGNATLLTDTSAKLAGNATVIATKYDSSTADGNFTGKVYAPEFCNATVCQELSAWDTNTGSSPWSELDFTVSYDGAANITGTFYLNNKWEITSDTDNITFIASDWNISFGKTLWGGTTYSHGITIRDSSFSRVRVIAGNPTPGEAILFTYNLSGAVRSGLYLSNDLTTSSGTSVQLEYTTSISEGNNNTFRVFNTYTTALSLAGRNTTLGGGAIVIDNNTGVVNNLASTTFARNIEIIGNASMPTDDNCFSIGSGGAKICGNTTTLYMEAP